jgi:hypothetical protein
MPEVSRASPRALAASSPRRLDHGCSYRTRQPPTSAPEARGRTPRQPWAHSATPRAAEWPVHRARRVVPCASHMSRARPPRLALIARSSSRGQYSYSSRWPALWRPASARCAGWATRPRRQFSPPQRRRPRWRVAAARKHAAPARRLRRWPRAGCQAAIRGRRRYRFTTRRQWPRAWQRRAQPTTQWCEPSASP